MMTVGQWRVPKKGQIFRHIQTKALVQIVHVSEHSVEYLKLSDNKEYLKPTHVFNAMYRFAQ